ncbi:DUF4238 domain-containing protein [Enterococcus plantarum]|uniref:DUF4238 domain-containing protein n=1 Tax=Enterococcus plantarum TaxID=1077675 RepID=UPI0015E8A2CE|nr:DUF4238 domain-containing protein [Enterococcus plantarum]
MTNPIKQHYVPQSYLNFFTDDSNYFYSYLVKSNKIIRQSPKNTGFQKNFYTLEYEGVKNYEIETYLANNIDCLYKPVVEKIVNDGILSLNDKKDLITFICFQYLRTPYHRENINKNLVKSFRFRNRANIDSNDNEPIDISKEHSLSHMFEFADEMIQMLMKHDFIILRSPKEGEFMTSDNPYCMVQEKWSYGSGGLGILNTAKFFPLTPKHLLYLRNPKNLDIGGRDMNPINLNRKEVRRLNLMIAYQAHHFIYTKNNHILNNITKTLNKKK